MMITDFARFKKLSAKGNLVAVIATVPADLETPVSCFLKVCDRDANAFLLESAEQEEHVGRYSIIGYEPSSILTSSVDGACSEIAGGKEKSVPESGDLLKVIAARTQRMKLANPEDLSGFTGGYVGYFGYENVRFFEDIKLSPSKGPNVPEGIFFLCHDFIVFDHFRKQMDVVSIVPVVKGAALKKAYDKACRSITRVRTLMKQPLKFHAGPKKTPQLKAVSNISRSAFESKIKKIKEYIRAGDCIQVVFSQRFTLPGVRDDFQIYRSLRSVNPSPYMFYFRCGKMRLVGSSPEVLVKKTGSEAEVRPIAGTRPRGRTLKEDLKYEEQMKRSKKEMAEHLMLVDLGRNDLGRVCRYESVKVKNFGRVERYSHVMHLVSDVVGKLKPGKTAFDLLRSTFPAGTLSGAPKIRAMQIINELEPERRGPYGGAMGYFSHTGDMDMCIMIRTLYTDGKKLYLQAGAGIVKDSHPGREFEETVNKAGALMKAIRERGKFDAAGH